MSACEARDCSCHCCCAVELLEPHWDLLGGTVLGETWAPVLLVCIRDGQAVSPGAPSTPCSVWEMGWSSSLVFLIQTGRTNMPFYRLSYFPSSTDLSVYSFEQNTKSLLLSSVTQKNASVITACILKDNHHHSQRPGAFLCRLLQAFPPLPTHILEQ